MDIVIEETFSANINEVWSALTEIEQMRQWYFEILPDFKPVVGFQTKFEVTNEDRLFTHNWKITEIDAPNKIAYEWTFDEYPGRSLTLFELESVGNSTLLKLTDSILEAYPDDIPEFKRESSRAGWGYFINNRLKQYLHS